jgi:hypothetical protein
MQRSTVPVLQRMVACAARAVLTFTQVDLNRR